ncbi:MAG: amidohydrolase family protein, partial [Gammaproteobacteria bacterium]|nr:amidohydrolase family protein [Gammaproteobacteria bacterium]
AEELDIPIHIHLHETADEVEQAVVQSGKRPIERLNELGMVSPRLLAVHMTQLNEDEIHLLSEAGAHVLHCPESNLKLASGFCPVHQLKKANINVALGTDGAASNNDLDMLAEMHTAALLAKAVANNASAIPAEEALRMATINGARALGLDAEIGSLEVGKSADITAVDLGGIENQPIYCPVSQLVYSAGRENVTNVWVAGNHLLKDNELTTLDEKLILEKSSYWREKITTKS